MNYTNSYGLPTTMLRALQACEHNVPEGAFSVTELIKSPRQYQLTKRHDSQITAELMDNIFSLLGQAFHQMMERHARGTAEDIFTAEHDGVVVAGHPDDFKDGIITDYKVTSAWSYIYGKPEWDQQLNLYRWLLKENGKIVTGAQISAVFRDWAKGRTYQTDYPPYPSMTLPVRLWPTYQTEHYLDLRIQEHVSAENLADDDLPECTPEERWKRPDKWAVYNSEDQQRASKLFDNEVEAQSYLEDHPNGKIEYRPGTSTRCQDYCLAAPFCNQWQAELEAGLSEFAEE
jgi:hypothetical protein